MTRQALPSKWRIVQYWAKSPDRDVFAPHLIDTGEPCCFACHSYNEHWDNYPTPQQRWEHAALERAHIVPDSLGGSSDPSNIVLFCKPCHIESPDWHEPSAMAHWIAARPVRGNQTMDKWAEAIQSVPEFQEFAERGGDAKRLGRYITDERGHASTHWGVGVSSGTYAAVLRAALLRIAKEDCHQT